MSTALQRLRRWLNLERLRNRILAMGVVALFVASATGMAAKPAETVSWSNGFPSGEHYNLTVHGRKDGFACDGSAGGGSVFVPEYGASQIDFVQNRRSTVGEMMVHDACGTFDGDSALVQLPAGEYQVYTRILAKP